LHGIFIAAAPFVCIDVAGEILADEAVKKHPQNILFEVPAVHAAAEVVGDLPDGTVQFGAFLFFYH
jgi:hypothetical protein